MHPLGWTVVALYAVIVVLIGSLASRNQKGTEDYFRGSRRLPWWALGISIIATAFSAASLLGGPGEGFQHGFLWLQLQLGDLLGYTLVAFLFIPLFVRLDLTTAYEYLERRFDAKTRSLGALYFIVFVVVRLGALLYGASIVVAEVAGMSLPTAILLASVVAIVYTMAGGLAAVVWTYVLQFGMILLGIGACVAVVSTHVEGGLAAVMSTANAAGRLQLVDWRWDPASLRTLPTAVFAYGMLAFAVAGTNQQSVQRYVACSDANAARKAAFLAWGLGLVGVASTLLLGVFLFAFYEHAPGRMPADVQPDRILPIFMARELPPVVAGLLAAAVFAAAMSSIDSALHSLSTCIVVDFYRRYMRRDRSEGHYLGVARILVLFWGLAGIGAALFVAQSGQALLPFMATYTSYIIGPVLGLFLLGLWVPRAGGNSAFWGACLAGVLMLLQARFGPWEIPGVWTTAVSAPLTLGCGALLACVGRARQGASQRLASSVTLSS